MALILTEDNYYSAEANHEYMSVSLFKDFAGTYGRPGCQAKTMAKLRGEFEEEPNTAMLVGSYVDHYFEGTLDKFRSDTPQLFKKDGGLRADFVFAENIITRIESDDVFTAALSGQKQVIMTGELFGIPWKIKIDSLLEGQCIVDLKIIKSFSESTWVRNLGYLNFGHYWGYDIQGAVYQEIVRQNTGETLPFYLACATKEDGIDIGLFEVDPEYLKEAMKNIRRELPDIVKVWKGEKAPSRCCSCKYCRMTKKLTGPKWLSTLDEQGIE